MNKKDTEENHYNFFSDHKRDEFINFITLNKFNIICPNCMGGSVEFKKPTLQSEKFYIHCDDCNRDVFDYKIGKISKRKVIRNNNGTISFDYKIDFKDSSD